MHKIISLADSLTKVNVHKRSTLSLEEEHYQIKTHDPPSLWFDSLETSTRNGQSKQNIIKLLTIALKGIMRRIRDENEVIFILGTQGIYNPKTRKKNEGCKNLTLLLKEKYKISQEHRKMTVLQNGQHYRTLPFHSVH